MFPRIGLSYCEQRSVDSCKLQSDHRVLASILQAAIVAAFIFGVLAAGYWPNVPIHAVATDRCDGFAMATGYCDEQVEAVYFLDFLTGDLSAAVVSKQTGRFNAFYTYNVAGDLAVNPGRAPRYLLTTGSADLRRSGGKANSLSRSLVYVSELNSRQSGRLRDSLVEFRLERRPVAPRPVHAVGRGPLPRRRSRHRRKERVTYLECGGLPPLSTTRHAWR